MKLVIIEPLGVEKETLLEIADKAVGRDTEIVYYLSLIHISEPTRPY